MEEKPMTLMDLLFMLNGQADQRELFDALIRATRFLPDGRHAQPDGSDPGSVYQVLYQALLTEPDGDAAAELCSVFGVSTLDACANPFNFFDIHDDGKYPFPIQGLPYLTQLVGDLVGEVPQGHAFQHLDQHDINATFVAPRKGIWHQGEFLPEETPPQGSGPKQRSGDKPTRTLTRGNNVKGTSRPLIVGAGANKGQQAPERTRDGLDAVADDTMCALAAPGVIIRDLCTFKQLKESTRVRSSEQLLEKFAAAGLRIQTDGKLRPVIAVEGAILAHSTDHKNAVKKAYQHERDHKSDPVMGHTCVYMIFGSTQAGAADQLIVYLEQNHSAFQLLNGVATEIGVVAVASGKRTERLTETKVKNAEGSIAVCRDLEINLPRV
ncbi:hypothetical protein ACFYXV_05470 [Streptomyces sp. NPDC002181]|uniref:hypothetical protein n=1 Tax=Streptomyces sp. NPDC002181 TaxID=3364635 RepID=UPI0036AE0260